MNIEKDDNDLIKVTQEHLELSLIEVRNRGKGNN